MSNAYFDADGVCTLISDVKCRKPNGGAVAEVPLGARPAAIWWDGEAVRESAAPTLDIPAVLEFGGEPFTAFLPAFTVAIVDGVRQLGTLTIGTDRIGQVVVDLRGAQSGEFIVQVRDYAANRKAAYPALADQLDALWKGGDALAAMQAQIMAVKAEFPKPE